MTRSTLSIRLDDDLRARLRAAALAQGTTVTDLVEQCVREGLAIERHPGVVFKPGSSGRRAALAGGPDVDQVISTLRRMPGAEARRIRAVAKQLGIHERQVVIALDYAAEHRDEIEARIAANEAALDAAEQIASERGRLLA